MDNLKPLLVHKFWMIFVFALLIPTIGWWFSTADLAASITKQWNTVEGAFRDSQVSDNVPNQAFGIWFSDQMVDGNLVV